MDTNQGEPGFPVELFDGLILVWRGDCQAPAELSYLGVRYFRFMDVFFVPHSDLDELSMPQVIALCRAREANSVAIGRPNEIVKSLFRRVVEEVAPKCVAEIGAGARPLYDGHGEKFEYIALDADEAAMSKLSVRKERFHGHVDELDIDSGSVDLAIAVFVFQFKLYSKQIEQISRILTPDGVLLANVYRRSEQSRVVLIAELRASGLHVDRVHDSAGLCRDHEYWVASRSQSSIERFRIVLNAQLERLS